jgi:peptidyl-lysine (3S)-dioxygenase / protease
MDATNSAAAWVRDQLDTLQQDYHDFNHSTVPTLPYPSALEFSKIVRRGQPCLFDVYHNEKDEPGPWPACSWTKEEMESKVKEEVEVALTPHGNADALVLCKAQKDDQIESKVFLQPASQHWTIRKLFETLSNVPLADEQERPVCYLQSQNSNLTTTPLEPLLSDLPSNFDFAEDVVGQPDARNIWIGDERSVTSIHRDPYENLYLVLRGSKTFSLWSPVDEASMPIKMVRTGRYQYSESSGFEVVMDQDDEIPWVDFDPLAADTVPVGRMRTVTVHAGQLLYLPASWFHHVVQSCGIWDDGSWAPCIAINYWYDQDYEGETYVMRQLVSRMVQTARDIRKA